MEVFTTHLDHNLIVNMIKTRIKQKQQNNIDSKLNVFDYLKSLSQEAKDLMDEIEDAKMTLITISFFLLVEIGEIVTLTFLG